MVVLATTCVLGGAALGAGSSQFGGHTAPLARRLVSGTGGLDGAPRIAFAALVLSLAAAAIGLVAARRATRTPQSPPWIGALGAPVRLLSRGAASGASLVRFFVRSVVVMNEDVIDDVTEVLAAGRGRSWAASPAPRRPRSPAECSPAPSGAAPTRSWYAPEWTTRTASSASRIGLVLGMVALLGLVVLSSVVLS